MTVENNVLKNSSQRLTVFISWSGSVSHAIGQALYSWLPRILPFIEPWLSSEKIAGGEKWNAHIESALQTCHIGIVCLTSENQESKWLHFEAGAIALRPGRPLVIPYLWNVSPEDITYPLAQFHSREANLVGTIRLVRDIVHYAKHLGISPPDRLDTSIIDEYPELETDFQHIRSLFGIPPKADFRLSAGVGLDYRNLIDNSTNEVIITAQNLQSLLRNGLLPFLKDRFQHNSLFRVLIVLTIPTYFNVVAVSAKEKRDFIQQYVNTVRNLNEFKSSLLKDRQSAFQVYFHPGVSSLSAIFRDPTDKNRGMVAFTPKWSTDAEPEGRIYCILDRATNDYLFSRMYGHIGIMKDPIHSKTLEEMVKIVNKDITRN